MKKGTKDSITSVGYYPPLNQMFSDLSPILTFQTPDSAKLRAPVCGEVCTDGGAMLLGVMAALMDVLGGGLALTAFYPDWAATTYLSVQSTGRALSGFIEAQGELKKTGRDTILVKVNIDHTPHEQGGFVPVAAAILTFTRFSPKKHSHVLQNDPAVGKATRLNTESTGLVQPFYDKVGLEILDDIKALVQVEMSDYVQNSFHTLNGGVVAFLSDLAGQTVARHVTGKPFVTTDLVIHFLRLGEVGPFQTRTSILRKTDETVLSFVEILDIGAGGRLVSIATNLATLDDLR